jgi:F0F1-type ATP synthase assembly protein I
MAFAQVGMEMVAPAAIGLFIDYRWNLLPWGTAIGAVVGFIGGFAHIFALLKRFEDNDRRRQDQEPK